MRNPCRHDHQFRKLVLIFLGLLATGVWAAGPAVGKIEGDSPTIVEDEDVPPGIAAGWIVGNRLLAEGKTSEALPYLHQAFRAHPEVVAIALDFQQALASEGYLKDALQVMDSLVAAWPDSQSFRMRRSALNLSAGRRDEALKDLREIRAQGAATVEVLAAEAGILASDGKSAQALDVLREGLLLFPEHGPDIFLEMARILQQSGQMDAIPPLMDEALGEFPDEPGLWLVKIRTLASLPRHDEALAAAGEADLHFSKLVQSLDQESTEGLLDPENLDMIHETAPRPDLPAESFTVELADFYAQHNQVDRALGILQPLWDQDELGLSPSLWLGRLLLGTGQLAEGVLLVDRILEKWPQAGRGWYLRGKIEEGKGDWEAAIPPYRTAAGLDPYDPEIRLGLIRAMLVAWEGDLRITEPSADQAAKAEEFSEQVMMASTLVNDQDTEGQMLLGYAFRVLGNLEMATWRFSLAAENPQLRMQALIQKSICHDENGEEGRARGDLEMLRREFPDDSEVANSLGYFLAEKGKDLDLAEDLIREALAAAPGNGAYLDSLGWVMYRNGRFEEAFDYLIQAVNVLPDDPVILEHLGVVMVELGQETEALDVLKRSLARGGDPERIGALISDIENGLEEKE